MSPFKRTERAKAKERARGTHARPGSPVYPLMRTPAVSLLVNPNAPAAEVPVELQSQDYEFPRVQLPDARPLVTADELLAAMEADDEVDDAPTCRDCGTWACQRHATPQDRAEELAAVAGGGIALAIDEQSTQPLPALDERGECGRQHRYRIWCAAIDAHVGGTFDTAQAARSQYELVPEDDEPIWDVVHPDGSYCRRESQRQEIASFGESALDGTVVDEALRPAQHEGLAPAVSPSIPVPANPFLNAAAPQSTQVVVRQGNALPARLTDVELAMLGRTVRLDTPQAPSLPLPLQRDAAHPYRFDAFDAEFWELVNDTARQYQAGPGGLRMSTDAAMDALDAHLAAVEAAHRAQIERGTGMEYAVWLASQLADADRPLPRRIPGASLAIEASRGELVAS